MELKQFPRIQTVTFTQNDFDGIQHQRLTGAELPQGIGA